MLYVLHFRTKIFLALPFHKESPFLEPIKKTLFEMAKSGVMKKLVDKYTTPINYNCEDDKVQYFFLLDSR